MSILEVKHLSHGFGERTIFEDVSFRLLKGEHIGLVGANGEGKSTFMSIVTGHLQPDEGKVEWSKYVTAGYLDQHTVLEAGMSVRDVLRTAFDELFKTEARINEIYMSMADDGADMDALMEEVGELQDRLESRDFYTLDAKIDEVARALGVMDFGMDSDVTELSGGQRTKVLLAKLLLEKPDILLLDEPTNYLDAEHIEWLKRYLQNYENAFVLISHDIPFLNDVINIVYHVENHDLVRYTGDYDNFQAVYAMKKAQLEAAYERQQKEIADLQDFVNRNKARVATRNMAMSRQKKLDKMERIELQSRELKGEVPLIGFSGSPWTLATYMVEGGSSKAFTVIKKMMYADPQALHALLDKLAKSVTLYLNAQIKAGAQSVMIFDTWGGVLTGRDYQQFSLYYMHKIVDGLLRENEGRRVPVTLFTKGGGQWLEAMAETGCDALGLDWTTDIADARRRVGNKVALQGNMDPSMLYAPAPRIEEEVATILAGFGQGEGHVFNLGHGIHQDVDPEHAGVFVEAVHRLSAPYHQ